MSNSTVNTKQITPIAQTFFNGSTPFYVGKGDAIRGELVIESPDGQDKLTLSIDNDGLAKIENDAFLGKLEVNVPSDITITSALGAVNLVGDDVNLTQLNPTGVYRGNVYLDINAQDNIRITAQNLVNMSGSTVTVTASAGETHNITGNLGITATGTGSIISSGNMNVGGQNLTLNGGNVGIKGDVVVQPTDVATTGAGKLDIKNGTGASIPATYTFYTGGDTGGGLEAGHLQLYSYAPNVTQILNFNPAGDMDVASGGVSIATAGKTVSVNSVPAQGIAPVNSTGLSTSSSNLSPVMWNNSTKQFVIPSEGGLLRYFRVNTPDSTGSPQDIIDPQGNRYNLPDWICCVAGFANNSGDRTYNCWTVPYNNSTWQVQYDNAGTSGAQVWILAISTSLIGCVQY